MADTEVVQRSGRGGAGNMWTRKDITDLKASSNDDLEAQIIKPETPPPSQEPSPAKYVHSGRGGAGNYFEASAEDEDDEIAKVLSSKSISAPKQESPPARSTGRGGAGNWFESKTAREKREAEEEQRRREEEERVEAMVRESIEAKLTKPEASYGCASDRGVRVGKSRLGVTMGDESLGV